MVTGGRFLNDQELVWFMVNEIPVSLERLKQMGDYLFPSGGMVRLRAEHGGLKEAEGPHSQKAQYRIDGGHPDHPPPEIRWKTVVGATALDLTTGEFLVIKAAAVVVATGGSTGELYPHTSNNPFGVTTGSSGSGHAMAYLAGAELIDMEMIQFVPLPANPRCLYLRYFPDFWAGPYQNRFGEVIESDANSYQGESYSYLFVQKAFQRGGEREWPHLHRSTPSHSSGLPRS